MATSSESPAREQGSMTSAIVVGAVTVLALLGIAQGVSIAARAATDATWVVSVPVRVTPSLPDDMPQTGLIVDETATMERMPTAPGGGLMMWLEHADPLTARLAAAPGWIAWLTAGVVVLLLLPVVRSTSSGRPFAAGNAGRVTATALTVAAGWALATALPVLAARRAVERELGNVPAAWFEPRLELQWWPVAFAGALVVLALAVRHGTKVVADTDALA
ncbi:hypothetical protein AB6N24_03625 [Cellulomonas sp. 179-A 4D5 NHS]|uniref:hypothetical protein n=1 Tax=Cellulomonas sp. 179-A 4D5 NHS TaxID=3142378 RepID=UPI0039A27834